jgi:hypothetical protein
MNNNDNQQLEEIYETAGVDLFLYGFNHFLRDVIKELYYSNKNEIIHLKVEHLDQAISKYKNASIKTLIQNTKQYFKACLLSTIKESLLYQNLYDTKVI